MKRWISFTSLLVVLLLVITACGSNTSKTTSKEGQEEQKEQEEVLNVDVEAKIEELKQNPSSGYEITEIERFYLTGNHIPEIVEITSEKVPALEAKTVKITTYQYSPGEDQWEVVFEKEFKDLYTNLEMIDSGEIMGDKRQQVAIGLWEGSGGFLSFIVLGSADKETVSLILDEFDGGFSNGNIMFEEDHLMVTENDVVVKTYQWGKSQVIEETGTVAQKNSPQSESIGEKDHIEPEKNSEDKIISLEDLPALGSSEEELIQKLNSKRLSEEFPEEIRYKFAWGPEENEHALIFTGDLVGNYGAIIDIQIDGMKDKDLLYRTAKNLLPSDAKLLAEDQREEGALQAYSSETMKSLTGTEYVLLSVEANVGGDSFNANIQIFRKLGEMLNDGVPPFK